MKERKVTNSLTVRYRNLKEKEVLVFSKQTSSQTIPISSLNCKQKTNNSI